MNNLHSDSGKYSRGRETGFSLLEVLAALAIMAIALSVLYQASSGAIRNTRVSKEYTVALSIAESAMAEFLVGVEEGKQSAGEYEHYRWVALASRFSLGDHAARSLDPMPTGLFLGAEVNVFWEGVAGDRQIRLFTLASADKGW